MSTADREAKGNTSDFPSRLQHLQEKPKINRSTGPAKTRTTPDAIKTESLSLTGNDFQS